MTPYALVVGLCCQLLLVGDGAATPQCAFGPNQPATCLTVGEFHTNDEILVKEAIKRFPFLLLKKSEHFMYPPEGDSGSSKITFMKVTNRMKAGEEGLATLNQGGPGHQNVAVYLESQRGKGFNFEIEIWGTANKLGGNNNE